LLAAAVLLGSCSSKSKQPGQSGPSVMFWLDSGNLAIESSIDRAPALGDRCRFDRIISEAYPAGFFAAVEPEHHARSDWPGLLLLLLQEPREHRRCKQREANKQ